MKIYFDESTHTYKSDSLDFTSVSSVISKYKQPFDKDGLSKKKAKERGVSQEEILAEWAEINKVAIDKGHKLHSEKEQELIDLGINVFPAQFENGLKISYDLTKLNPGIYPELILYSPFYKVCGTSDVVIIYPDKTFDVEDYKSNKELKFESFKKFNQVTLKKEPVMMKSPVSHLQDCNGLHYTIQLSLYAFMLEQFGYKCKSLTLRHMIQETDNWREVPYTVPYLKKEVYTLLNHFKSKNK